MKIYTVNITNLFVIHFNLQKNVSFCLHVPKNTAFHPFNHSAVNTVNFILGEIFEVATCKCLCGTM